MTVDSLLLFTNPARIETISAASWDWDVQNALLHFRGAGTVLPDPEIRYWTFPNGFGVAARLSRELLLAGFIHYDVWMFQAGGLSQFKEPDLRARGLPPDLVPTDNLTPEEVEEYLLQVRSIRDRGGKA